LDHVWQTANSFYTSAQVDGPWGLHDRTTPAALAALNSNIKSALESLGPDDSAYLPGYHTMAYAVASKEELDTMTSIADVFAKSALSDTNALVITACQEREKMHYAYTLTHRAPGATMDLLSWRTATELISARLTDEYELALRDGTLTGHATNKALQQYLIESLQPAGPAQGQLSADFPNFDIHLMVVTHLFELLEEEQQEDEELLEGELVEDYEDE
jgi:hypothetical protein